MEQENCFYFTKDQLFYSPSRKHGMDLDTEFSHRKQAAAYIRDIGSRLQVTQLCNNTAIVFMHRFYVFHSFTVVHRYDLSVAAFFLASKVLDQPRPLEHVIKVSYALLNRDAPHLDVRSPVYLKKKEDLLYCENLLLQTLGFRFGAVQPHAYVDQICTRINACKELSSTSYSMATSSLHLTVMCLQYRPAVVAAVCINLACQWINERIEPSPETKDWYRVDEESVTPELLESLTQKLHRVLKQNPRWCEKNIVPRKQVTTGHLIESASEDSKCDSSNRGQDVLPSTSWSASFDLHAKKQTATVPVPSAPKPKVSSHAISIDAYRDKRAKERLQQKSAVTLPPQQPPILASNDSLPSTSWSASFDLHAKKQTTTVPVPSAPKPKVSSRAISIDAYREKRAKEQLQQKSAVPLPPQQHPILDSNDVLPSTSWSASFDLHARKQTATDPVPSAPKPKVSSHAISIDAYREKRAKERLQQKSTAVLPPQQPSILAEQASSSTKPQHALVNPPKKIHDKDHASSNFSEHHSAENASSAKVPASSMLRSAATAFLNDQTRIRHKHSASSNSSEHHSAGKKDSSVRLVASIMPHSVAAALVKEQMRFDQKRIHPNHHASSHFLEQHSAKEKACITKIVASSKLPSTNGVLMNEQMKSHQKHLTALNFSQLQSAEKYASSAKVANSRMSHSITAALVNDQMRNHLKQHASLNFSEHHSAEKKASSAKVPASSMSHSAATALVNDQRKIHHKHFASSNVVEHHSAEKKVSSAKAGPSTMLHSAAASAVTRVKYVIPKKLKLSHPEKPPNNSLMKIPPSLANEPVAVERVGVRPKVHTNMPQISSGGVTNDSVQHLDPSLPPTTDNACNSKESLHTSAAVPPIESKHHKQKANSWKNCNSVHLQNKQIPNNNVKEAKSSKEITNSSRDRRNSIVDVVNMTPEVSSGKHDKHEKSKSKYSFSFTDFEVSKVESSPACSSHREVKVKINLDLISRLPAEKKPKVQPLLSTTEGRSLPQNLLKPPNPPPVQEPANGTNPIILIFKRDNPATESYCVSPKTGPSRKRARSPTSCRNNPNKHARVVHPKESSSQTSCSRNGVPKNRDHVFC